MNLHNMLYRNKRQFEEFVAENDIGLKTNILIQIFSGVIDKQEIKNTINDILSILPNAAIIGATTTGEIIDGKTYSDSIVVSIATFNSVRITTKIVTDNTDICDISNAKLILLFSAGIGNIPNKIIKKLSIYNPNAIIAGGAAGDNDRLQETWVFCGNEIIENGSVLAVLSGNSLFVKQAMKFNWQPMGNDMIVTDADNGLVRTINGYSVHELYKKYFGESVINNLLATASLFPLMQKRGSLYVSNILLNVNSNGTCLFSGNLATGDRVVFGCANIDMLLDNNYLCGTFDYNIEGIFVYSCGGRKKLLQKDIDKEIFPLSTFTPVAGFFTYAEYYTTADGSHEILNNTMTMVALSEHSYKRSHDFASFIDDEKTDLVISPRKIFQAMTNFTNAITAELIESNKHISNYAMELNVKNYQLELLYMTDKLTSIYNRYKLDEVMAEQLAIFAKTNEQFSIILLDIDFFKNINDTYGHNEGDNILKSVAKAISTNIQEGDILGRWGGEEFLIICPKTKLQSAISIAETIRIGVLNYKFSIDRKVTASLGVACCEHDDDISKILKRADDALYDAKASGRNCVKSHVLDTGTFLYNIQNKK